MTIPSVPTLPSQLDRIGGWLFARRTLLPLPLALVLLLIRAGETAPSAPLFASGVAVLAAGEALRLWGVRHIGTISRTRSDRLGPLVTSGPFAFVRNPLYTGNVALWIGFALCARLVWMAPLILVLLGFAYHAIVRWEEQLLESRRGDEYRAYAAAVPRWWPAWRPHPQRGRAGSHSWRETLFSERGTLIAIGAGILLLWIKARVWP